MQKIQILFPDPTMERLRRIAEQRDIPISEMVRKATDLWLERIPEKTVKTATVPVINAGKCLLNANEMKDALYE